MNAAYGDLGEGVITALFIVGIGIWIAVSVAFKMSTGKATLTPPISDAVFWEQGASGRSHRNVITFFNVAQWILQVAVTPHALIVRPSFPFNFELTVDIWRLDLTIPLSDVRRLSLRPGAFLRQSVFVEFARADGAIEKFELRLKDAEGFAKAIGKPLE